MIVLDENIAEDQCQLLRSWRIRCRQIGQDIGKQGMQDEQHVIPMLQRLSKPTFVTRDLGFFHKKWCHDRYSLVCLAVSQNEVARFVRRFLRHPSFDAKVKRMGTVICIGQEDLRVWRRGVDAPQKLAWPKRPRK